MFPYFFVGAVNTAFAYAVFSLLTFLGLEYAAASFFSTVAGVFFNFKTIGACVFGNSNSSLIGRFACVYAVVYTVNLIGLWALRYFGFSSYSAAAILAVPVGLLGFFLNRKFVFS